MRINHYVALWIQEEEGFVQYIDYYCSPVISSTSVRTN